MRTHQTHKSTLISCFTRTKKKEVEEGREVYREGKRNYVKLNSAVLVVSGPLWILNIFH